MPTGTVGDWSSVSPNSQRAISLVRIGIEDDLAGISH
jgi:hypothetical protein